MTGLAQVKIARRRRGWYGTGFVPLLLSIVWSGTNLVQAADLTGKNQSQPVPWLLGDWNRVRTQLQDLGIDFQFGYTGEFAYNATGGSRSTGAYADQYVAGTTLNLDRLVGIRDATFQATWTERTGRNLSSDAGLGTLQQVQEIFGRGQTARLTQFWFDQKFANGAVDWKVGRMTVGEDFASFSCDFQNLTFCGSDPGNLVGNYIFNWPVSQWATRFKFNLDGFGYLQVGVYDANPKYLGTQNAVLPVFYSGSTGALIPVELAWLPNFGGRLPGSYKVGAWYDTSSTNDVVSDIQGKPFTITGLPPMQHSGRYGAFINFSQQLTSLVPNSKQGASAFLNAVVADDLTSTTDAQIAGGLIYTGPLQLRPDDDIAIALGATHVNSRVAYVQALENAVGLGPVPVQGTEYALELYYTYRPTNGLLLRPNVQYVINPGGSHLNRDALILGLKTSASF
jgi:porin